MGVIQSCGSLAGRKLEKGLEWAPLWDVNLRINASVQMKVPPPFLKFLFLFLKQGSWN